MTAEEDFDKQCAKDNAQRVQDSMPIPPQVKYGIALMEMDNGSVVRVPINPHELNVTYGQMLRLVMGEMEDIRAEILAMKIKKSVQPQAPLPGSGLLDT